MPLAILIVVLIALYYLLKVFVSADFAQLVLGVISMLFTLTYEESRKLFGLKPPKLGTSRPPFTSHGRRRLSDWFQYTDLSFLLLAVTILGVVIHESFVDSVQGLVRLGLIRFDAADQGFIQLQKYLGGYVLLPILLLVMAGYGFQKGFHEKACSFLSLLLSTAIGSGLTVGYFHLLRGAILPQSSSDLMAHAASGMPLGTKIVRFFEGAGALMLLDAFLSFLGWLSSLLGRVLRILTDRLKASGNSTRASSTATNT